MIALSFIGFLAVILAIGYLLYLLMAKLLSKRAIFNKMVFWPLMIGGLILFILGATFGSNDSSAQALSEEKQHSEKLTQQMNDLTKKNEDLQKKYDELSTKLASINTNSDDDQKEISSLKDQISTLTADKDALAEQLKTEQANSENLKQQLESAKSQPVASAPDSSVSSFSDSNSSSSSSNDSNQSEPDSGNSSNSNVYYKNCTAARAAGAAPLRTGDPGYAPHLDRDGDGLACE